MSDDTSSHVRVSHLYDELLFRVAVAASDLHWLKIIERIDYKLLYFLRSRLSQPLNPLTRSTY